MTHIRLHRSDRIEFRSILVPLAGTVFELTPDYETIATLSNGRVINLEESLHDIQNTIDCLQVMAAAD